MEPSGRLSESVSSHPLAGAIEQDELWIRLEQKLGALAAIEQARPCRSRSLGGDSKAVLAAAAQWLIRRIVETLQQSTNGLPRPEQRAEACTAIGHLFALDLGPSSGEGIQKHP